MRLGCCGSRDVEVPFSYCCCGSEDVAASHSHIAVAAAETSRRHTLRLLSRQQRWCGIRSLHFDRSTGATPTCARGGVADGGVHRTSSCIGLSTCASGATHCDRKARVQLAVFLSTSIESTPLQHTDGEYHGRGKVSVEFVALASAVIAASAVVVPVSDAFVVPAQHGPQRQRQRRGTFCRVQRECSRRNAS